jgi:tetratricopeptide (TPR) repeat protein
LSESRPDLDALWDYVNPAATEERFRELLPGAEADPGYHCELLTQIARTQGLQRRFEDAHKTLDSAESMAANSSPRCAIRILLERGRAFNSAGEPAKAKPPFIRAWEIATESGEEALEVDAAHMMAIIEPRQQALEWNEKAMATAERSSDPKARKWMGSLYNNTGWTYHDSGDYERALGLFVKAMKFRMEQGDEPRLKIARWCVARCLRSLGRLDEALSMQMELAKDHATAGTSDGFVAEELGEILLAQGKAEEAKPHFAKAFEELSKDAALWDNEPERLRELKELGGL